VAMGGGGGREGAGGLCLPALWVIRELQDSPFCLPSRCRFTSNTLRGLSSHALPSASVRSFTWCSPSCSSATPVWPRLPPPRPPLRPAALLRPTQIPPRRRTPLPLVHHLPQPRPPRPPLPTNLLALRAQAHPPPPVPLTSTMPNSRHRCWRVRETPKGRRCGRTKPPALQLHWRPSRSSPSPKETLYLSTSYPRALSAQL